jgi:hypothetical protein
MLWADSFDDWVPTEAAHPARKLTMESIMGMKAYLETTGGGDSKIFKRVSAGKNMSDPEFLDFLNAIP